MRQALQAILIAPDPKVRLDIMLGKKKLTIREGHRDYKVGPVVICCHIYPWAVMATITSVRLTTLSEVTMEEYEADGYANHKEMLRDLRKIYPGLTMKSEVTVICWDNLEGYFTDIDNVQEYADSNGLDMSFE
jgi:hypothetical protein